jgi:hypothetical protein
VTSSLCRRSCRTRSSTQLQTSQLRRSWFAAVKNRLSSTSILKVPNQLHTFRNRILSIRRAGARLD